MSNAPVRPRRRNRNMISNIERPGTLFQTEEPVPTTETPIPNYQLPRENIELQKFAQLILYGISLAAIWGGILSIAFLTDSTTNENFLVL